MGGVTHGCENPYFPRNKRRPQDIASSKGSRSSGRVAGPTLHWSLRLGVFQLEAGILSPGRISKEVPRILRNPIELGRSELHLPPVADGEHTRRLAGRKRRRLSLLVQSAAADHSLPSTQEMFRRSRRLIACTRACRGYWT